MAQSDPTHNLLEKAAEYSLRERRLGIVVLGGANLEKLGGNSAAVMAEDLAKWLESLKLEAKFFVASTDYEESAILIFDYGLAFGPAALDLAAEWLEKEAEIEKAKRELIALDPENEKLLEERELLKRELAIAEGKTRELSELIAELGNKVATKKKTKDSTKELEPEKTRGGQQTTIDEKKARPVVEIAVDPRVMLIVLGDPVFAGGLDRELEARLRAAGFDVADAGGVREPADTSLAEIVPRLATQGDLLVGVEIERLGERELRYLGREEWLFSARLDLQAFLLPTGRALGGWGEEVEYTEAMVAAKVEQCFADLMPELSQTLRTSWDDYRASRIAAAAAAKTASAAGSGQPRRKKQSGPAAVADPLAAYNSGDYLRAAELWGAACTGGETVACYNLGLIYLDGAAGVAKDPRRAAELFQQACDGGEAAGCFNLGAMYASGDGIPRDTHKSAALLRQACNGGAEAACFNLGLLYFTGESVLPRDPGKAGELFQQACDGGYAPGCFNLGTLYGNGEAGFPRDENKAAVLFQQACEGGESLGCSNLELLCERNPTACEPLDPR